MMQIEVGSSDVIAAVAALIALASLAYNVLHNRLVRTEIRDVREAEHQLRVRSEIPTVLMELNWDVARPMNKMHLELRNLSQSFSVADLSISVTAAIEFDGKRMSHDYTRFDAGVLGPGEHVTKELSLITDMDAFVCNYGEATLTTNKVTGPSGSDYETNVKRIKLDGFLGAEIGQVLLSWQYRSGEPSLGQVHGENGVGMFLTNSTDGFHFTPICTIDGPRARVYVGPNAMPDG